MMNKSITFVHQNYREKVLDYYFDKIMVNECLLPSCRKVHIKLLEFIEILFYFCSNQNSVATILFQLSCLASVRYFPQKSFICVQMAFRFIKHCSTTDFQYIFSTTILHNIVQPGQLCSKKRGNHMVLVKFFGIQC